MKSELTDEYYIANPVNPTEKKNVTRKIHSILEKDTQKNKKIIAILVEELYGSSSTNDVLNLLHDAGMTEQEVKDTNAFQSERVEKFYKGI